MTGAPEVVPAGTPRSVVVTGVSQAGQLGEEIAKAFGAAGARLAIVARSRSDVDARAEELRAGGFDVEPFACDLADVLATEALAGSVAARLGSVDALVNVAGGFAVSGPVGASDPSLLSDQIARNLTTAYLATRAFLPSLRQARGAVVFFSSVAALPGARVREVSAYAIAKAGLITLMRAVSQEERAAGVRANAVALGSVRTATNLATMPPDTRYVEPAEVATVVRFLCSRAAARVTGQVIELAP